MHASHVIRQTTVLWCGNDITKRAELNVAGYWGQSRASDTVAAVFKPASWTVPGDAAYAEWSGDCVKLGNAAWHFAGRAPLTATRAIGQRKAYDPLGRLQTAGTSPMGALVFYDYSSVGHVNVSVGRGWVVTTNGVDFDWRASSFWTVASYGSSYRGWAMP